MKHTHWEYEYRMDAIERRNIELRVTNNSLERQVNELRCQLNALINYLEIEIIYQSGYVILKKEKK